jgi:CRISPR-associated protein Cmr5
MKTLDQQYAASAYTQVLSIKVENEKSEYAKYGAMAHKLPLLIYTAGLVQALEFVHSRGNPLQQRLLTHLAMTTGQSDTEALLATVRNASLSQYIRLTKQILAALLWYKRFAQSILEVDVTEALSEEKTSDD